jgi:ParB family chromosome partitioning protein
LAGLERIPAVVREVPDEAALGIGLIENIQREDLNPIEEANGLKRLIDEFKLTHDEVAQAIGRSRAGVTNLLRLLELAAAVQEMVQDGRIDMGHARALVALPKARQVELAQRIAQQGLSVREAERLVQAASSAPRAGRPSAARLDADSRRLQEELSERLGATVKLKPRRGGKGSVVIDYSSLDELQGIVAKLRD